MNLFARIPLFQPIINALPRLRAWPSNHHPAPPGRPASRTAKLTTRWAALALAVLIVGVVVIPAAAADVVETTDGARLVGRIAVIEKGRIHLETSYAGTLEIDQAKVAGFTTDSPLFVRLQSGSVQQGVARPQAGGGAIEVVGADGALAAPVSEIQSSWRPGEDSPEEKARRAAQSKWTYQAAADIQGKSGNSDEFNAAIHGEAVRTGPRDKLKFYVSHESADKDGETTSDETIGGVDYSNFFHKRLGWYARTELERDPFEDIDLRSTSGAGLAYKFLDAEGHKLEGRLGLLYRYEAYDAAVARDDLSEPGIDAGLAYLLHVRDWGKFTTDLAYQPSFSDFGDYLLKQDSAFEAPLGGLKRWFVRIGVQNEYNSNPAPGLDELDTTWYTRLILRWE